MSYIVITSDVFYPGLQLDSINSCDTLKTFNENCQKATEQGFVPNGKLIVTHVPANTSQPHLMSSRHGFFYSQSFKSKGMDK